MHTGCGEEEDLNVCFFPHPRREGSSPASPSRAGRRLPGAATESFGNPGFRGHLYEQLGASYVFFSPLSLSLSLCLPFLICLALLSISLDLSLDLYIASSHPFDQWLQSTFSPLSLYSSLLSHSQQAGILQDVYTHWRTEFAPRWPLLTLGR